MGGDGPKAICQPILVVNLNLRSLQLRNCHCLYYPAIGVYYYSLDILSIGEIFCPLARQSFIPSLILRLNYVSQNPLVY
uniref:Uncharacterized protein n=1 Tax=Onchocerca volvulus TaxID=6282 RepID=A0A8R1U1S6_ONCVO